jgi:probable O-glycosylation ligase (exosortase A-associated)
VLGLLAVVALLALCGRRQALLAAFVACAVFLTFTPAEKFFARIGTIRTFRQDVSAAMRPGEWYVAFRLGLEHPLLGAGFRPFDNATYRRYIPDSTDYRDAHNLFLQVFAEHGLPGLALYAALLVSTLTALQRRARQAAAAPGCAWIADAARMIQIGLVGYVVAAQFHCLSYRTLLFDLVILAIIVDALAAAALDDDVPVAVAHS